MYQKAYGIIETLAPLHVGASAGEETGNLNLIFRDQFTQTGIIPGSSIRGRFRADMRQEKGNVDYWYGKEAKKPQNDTDEKETTTEGVIKFEYASVVWIPVFCPNQPIVRVSCPALLRRYQKITDQTVSQFTPYSYFGEALSKTLFFNLGSLPLKKEDEALQYALPKTVDNGDKYLLLVVDDKEISIIHDMALYRQSRVALEPNQKKVAGTSFFNVEALPEGTVMAFPIALRKEYDDKEVKWGDFLEDSKFIVKEKEEVEEEGKEEGKELYFGGLESVGFGRTKVSLPSRTFP